MQNSNNNNNEIDGEVKGKKKILIIGGIAAVLKGVEDN
jgi:hypothetical protein